MPLVATGDLRSAEAAARSINLTPGLPLVAFAVAVGATARLCAAQGRLDEALDLLVGSEAPFFKLVPVAFPWRAEAALILTAKGEAIALARQEADLAERHGSVWAGSIALPALAGAEGSITPQEKAAALTSGTPG